MAIGGLIAGALLGTISTTGSAYLFGANIWASVLTGASLGYSFATAKVKGMASPTYSLNEISNTKTQLLPIPIVYGRARIAGNIFYVKYHDSHKQKADEYIAISEGPISSISQIKAGDQLITDLSKCSVSIHLDSDGSTSDPRDPAGNGDPRPYPDNLAFIAATLKAQEKYNGNEAITSIVEGRLVRTPGGVVYTRNPAWIVRDLLTNKRYGFGFPETVIDDDSFREAAAYCDGAPDNGAAPRFTLDYVIDEKDKGIDILKKMLSCFRGYIVCRDRVELHVEKPSSIINQTVGMGDIVEGSFKWWQSGHDDILNRVIIEWIDPDNSWERTTTIFEDAGDIEKRGIVEKTFSLLGITRADQAARMGAYLLDTSQAVTDFCSFNVGLKKADVEEGDIISLTYDLPGWTGKLMRVTAVKDGENNSIELTCAEYVEEIYNDRAMDFQRHIDTNLDNPWDPDEVTDLDITEQLILGSDGTYHQTAEISWTLPEELLKGMEVWWKYSLESVWKQAATLSPYSTAYTFLDMEIGAILQVKVITISRFDVRSKGTVATSKLNGDGEPPAVPAGVTAEGGYRTITLKWNQVASLDFSHVEVWESLDDDISNAYKIAETSATYFVVSNLGTMNTRWYWLKAVDYAGNESGFSTVVSATTLAIPQEDLPELEISETQTDELLTRSYEQLERDAEGTIQGLLRSYRDRQNSITEVARVNDQVGAMYTLRLESDGSIVGVAMQAGKDAADIVFRADRVFFKTSSGEAVPMFTLQDGQAYFNSDVFADGSIVGNKIYSKSTISLADGGRLLIGNSGLIQIGDGAIVIDGSDGSFFS